MILNEILEKFGLNNKESAVYLAVLQLGQCSISEIAQKAQTKRTTVYRIVDELAAKGFITKIPKEKKVFFMAENPEALLDNLAKKEKIIREALPLFQAIYNSSETRPKIKFYEGKEGARTLIYDSLKNNKSKEVLWIWPFKDAWQVLGKEENLNYIRERIRLGIWAKNIRPKEKELGIKESASAKKYLREVRFSPQGMDYSVTVGIYDNKVSVFSSEKESFGFIIESNEFAQLMKHLFGVLWQVSTPAK